MASSTDLEAYVGSNTEDSAFVASCFAQATALVSNFVGTQVVPPVIVDRAVLEVGAELFHRRQAPNGVAQYTTYDGAPVRIARDPMVAAYPILSRFMVVGF